MHGFVVFECSVHAHTACAPNPPNPPNPRRPPAKYKCGDARWCIAHVRCCLPLGVSEMHRVAHKRSSPEGRATVTRKYGYSELSLSFAFILFPSLLRPLRPPFYLLLFLSLLILPSTSLACLAAFQWPALFVFVHWARYRLSHEKRSSRSFSSAPHHLDPIPLRESDPSRRAMKFEASKGAENSG